MSHEHRQNPERYYDDEGEAYEPDDLPVSEGHTWPYDFDTWYGPAR